MDGHSSLVFGATLVVALTAACGSSSSHAVAAGGASGASSAGASTTGGTGGDESNLGGSTSDTGGSSTQGEAGSSTSGGASASGGAGSGPTSLAGGLSQVLSLTVIGSNLYWVNGQNVAAGAIQTMPITGGTPKTVLAAANLQGDLATDGTLLYFTARTSGQPFDEIDSIGLDGSGQKTLVTGLLAFGHSSLSSELFVVAGNLYFGSAVGPVTAPATGGTVTNLTPGLQDANARLDELIWVDSSGAYFTYISMGTLSFGDVPLVGGTLTQLATPPLITVNSWGGDFTIVGGTAYYISDAMISAAVLYKAAAPSGPATSVKTFTNETQSSIIADAAGMFAIEGSDSNTGIYEVDPATGAQTPLFIPTNGTPVNQVQALDAQNLYFALGGQGSYSIYALKR
jgi:hypothetical protein